MQVKAYVRAHGVPDKWEERDRGYLSLWYNYWASEYIDSHDPIKFAKKNGFIHPNITYHDVHFPQYLHNIDIHSGQKQI